MQVVNQVNTYYHEAMQAQVPSTPTLAIPPHADVHRQLSTRRTIRDFSDQPLDTELLERIVQAAGDAPSSLGVQPYEVHLVVGPDLRDQLATACNGQRAARSAQALVVFVVSVNITRRRIEESRAYYQSAPLSEKSRAYHLAGLARLSLSLHPWLLPILSIASGILSWVQPSRSMLPLGSQGARGWAARAAMLAAQNMLMAASAHDVDACPMEGFSGAQVAQTLGLPRGAVPTLVVALGYRATDARIEPRFRRTAAQMITTH